MMKILKFIRINFEFIRCFPHLVLFYFHKNRSVIQADTIHWQQIIKTHYKIPFAIVGTNLPIGFIYILSFFPEFRNLFYYRIGVYSHLLNIFCPKLSSLIIDTEEIGEGLFIQHGHATIIGAKSIGKNCFINQQVTIAGYPTILNNVKISAGAVIIGKVIIGNNVVIGANAAIFCDIPDNSTVYPPSPRIMKWK